MTTQKFTEAETSEQAGSAMAQNCLNDILGSQSQAESVSSLISSIQGLPDLKHSDSVLTGFCSVLASAIETGLKAKSKKPKPTVNLFHMPKEERPTLGKLGDVLKQATFHVPSGYALIEGSDKPIYDSDEADIYLFMSGVTACIVGYPVSIYIRQGTPVHLARDILKAAASGLKNYKSFDNVAPLTERETVKNSFDSIDDSADPNYIPF